MVLQATRLDSYLQLDRTSLVPSRLSRLLLPFLFRHAFLARKDCVTSQRNRSVRVLQPSEAICRSRAFSDDKLPNKCVEKITENKKVRRSSGVTFAANFLF